MNSHFDMIFNLNLDYDRERFKTRSTFLLEKRRVVELTEKTGRTGRQNNYFHLALTVFSLDYGESLEYVKQEIFKRHVNPDIFVVKKSDKILGEVEILKSSADISKEDMITAIDRFKVWSTREAGIFIPDAFSDDERIELMRQIEIHKNYL